ncbi:hypothetical protein FISHEDRAFT_35143, partial [Fistulina hepatica ATCC 64428]
TADVCANQIPWAVDDNTVYEFAAADIAGGSASTGAVLAISNLTFTSTSIAGKMMVVQAANTVGDIGSNQFDLAIPRGGIRL